MATRGRQAVATRRAWVRHLADAARHAYPEAPRDRPRELTTFLSVCPPLTGAFAAARRRSEDPPTIREWFVAETAMGRAPWPVASLHTQRDVQDLLGMSTATLMWFADTRRVERTVADERLRHYRYHWTPKRNGGARLIEAPKPVLKHLQRVLLWEILEHVPVHPAVHGFRRGRSALSHANGHLQRKVVIRVDLEDFFASVRAGRVYGIFRACGYPEPVAHVLTALTTNAVPRSVWAQADAPSPSASEPAFRRLAVHLAHPHLPQGAPTSPTLANLAAFGLDRRLAGLASSAELTYTRYADDLAFSSVEHRPERQSRRLVDCIGGIAEEEGFRVNVAKTSVRQASQRQRLAGVVVNERVNIERRQYDLLKATLHNAARRGPAGQNRSGHPAFRDHLRGRIAWVHQLTPARGERLLATFAQIDWDGADR
ncbi:MAG TPA: reverse transcriptase family protein [Acidimicrobiales bacterium]|nr:reverse transcriptase family protein [Acidimicrobiales bacterium]